jgi:acetyl-CoA carboxylase alpha subunit
LTLKNAVRQAIAYNLREMAKLSVPVLLTVIGEGSSGGALAVVSATGVLMLENAASLSRRRVAPRFCGKIPARQPARLKA